MRRIAVPLILLPLVLSSCAESGAGRPPPDATAGDGGTAPRRDGGASDGGMSGMDGGGGGTDAPTVGPDAGAADAGGPDLCAAGTRIDAPEDVWSFVSVPGSRCGYGSEAGFGIQPTSRSRSLLVFFMGGGACLDAFTCGSGAAANLHGYDATSLGNELRFFQPGSVLDRGAASNPFRDYSFVFVPYCTGDFHSGSRDSSYGVAHAGYTNVGLYLPHIVATFCDADRVVLAGSSAGGFGATFNFDRVQRAFGDVPVDLVDDSGPYLRDPFMAASFQAQLHTAWGWADNVPAGCPECRTEWQALYRYIARAHPDRTMSLITSLQDHSIGAYFRLGGPQMHSALDALADELTLPRFRVFYLAGSDHVWLSRDLAATRTAGVPLSQFLTEQLTHAPTWRSLRP